MNVIDLFNLGNKYHAEGKLDMALQIWTECIQNDRLFSVPLINIHNILRQQGNLVKAREALLEFKRRPLTGETLDMLPRVNHEIEEINKQLQPPAPQK